ncbi:MAG: FAD-dependent oxidoreductase [Alphaproteobacteria bacterium]|nr:FAD-dependent oxidoreductase [Alphaproteobacteria bacterium]
MGDVALADAKVAIVGGGPAGMSMARLLKDQGVSSVTVFEAEDRIGGKSMTVHHGGLTHDMGTCYSTLAYQITNRWMRDLGVRQVSVGRQMVDGEPLMAYVRGGKGESLYSEGLRYIRLWHRYRRAVQLTPDDPDVIVEGAMPIEDWLERHRFVRIRRFMLRALTSIGYGYLDDIAACQALRWCTPALILTGVLHQLKMPIEGWQVFWEKVARDIDVRIGAPVKAIDRTARGVTITDPLGEHHFTHLVTTIPLDDMASVTELTEAERYIQQAVRWRTYAVTLCHVENWFKNFEIDGFTDAWERSAEPGAVLSARRARSFGGRNVSTDIYLTGQYGDGQSAPELLDRLAAGIARKGGRLKSAILQKRWKYFPRYEPAAVRDRLLSRMNAIQGANRTFYSGATFSYEAVANIVDFNDRLSRQIVPQLRG